MLPKCKPNHLLLSFCALNPSFAWWTTTSNCYGECCNLTIYCSSTSTFHMGCRVFKFPFLLLAELNRRKKGIAQNWYTKETRSDRHFIKKSSTAQMPNVFQTWPRALISLEVNHKYWFFFLLWDNNPLHPSILGQ